MVRPPRMAAPLLSVYPWLHQSLLHLPSTHMTSNILDPVPAHYCSSIISEHLHWDSLFPGFPGNWWANLTSIPTVTANLLLSAGAKTATVSCPASVAVVGGCSRTLLQTCKISLSIKPLTSLSLTLGSFFGLKAGQAQGLQACGVQHRTCNKCKEKGQEAR